MIQKQDPVNKYRKTLTELITSEENPEEEIANLHHELRRVKDGIERVGGSSHEFEQKAKQLVSNIELCERDLEENQKQQEKVSKQLNSPQNSGNID